MVDIELVIKIDEDVYKARQHWVANPTRMVDEVDIAIANGTPLDEIRAEIEKLRPHNLRPEQMTDYDYAMVDVVNDIVAIIDKYRKEQE